LETVKFCTSYQYEGNLDILGPYLIWEPIDNKRARIIDFKKPDSTLTAKNGPAQILLRCKPLEFKEFTGWEEDITKAKSLEELPTQARECISFLQNKEGLNVPIKIISVNPTWEGKIIIKNP
jgi:adenylosuccinate synthase